jgi:hypothetical protein
MWGRMTAFLALLLFPFILATAPASRAVMDLNFCCSPDQVLDTKRTQSILEGFYPRVSAACRPALEEDTKYNLEWESILVLDTSREEDEDGRYIEMSIRKQGETDVQCNSLSMTPLKLATAGEKFILIRLQ